MSTDSEGTFISMISSTSLTRLPSRRHKTDVWCVTEFFPRTKRVCGLRNHRTCKREETWEREIEKLNLPSKPKRTHHPWTGNWTLACMTVLWQHPKHHFAIGISSAVDFCISAMACLQFHIQKMSPRLRKIQTLLSGHDRLLLAAKVHVTSSTSLALAAATVVFAVAWPIEQNEKLKTAAAVSGF